MFNFKWGVFSGGAAFVLALLLGLLFGHVGFLIALLRALIFAVAFFALGVGIYLVINSYIPELLVSDTGSESANIFSLDTPGSRVNITLGDSGGEPRYIPPEGSGAALPEAGSGSGEVGDIGDLGSVRSKQAVKDMDQTRFGDYTGYVGESGGAGADAGMKDFSPDFPAFNAGRETAGQNTEPAANFSGSSLGVSDFSGFGDDDPFGFGDAFGSIGSSDAAASPEPERKVSGNKTQALDGDFNPKEIAVGIRTVLENDKKG